jgi:phosphopantothenoylcysteine decarboxylase/phosphopantothenate--cysteine ligase
MAGKRVLLIVGGGVAAYKALELVRLLRKADIAVRPILTRAGAQFVTPLSLGALSEDKVYQALFSLTDEAEMGHIELSRSADLIVVAPATADLMAKAAAGLADDLASTTLLATDTPVMMAPAMNVRMWEHAATRQNALTLTARGVTFVGPGEGAMACGEFGMGRLAEPQQIVDAILAALNAAPLQPTGLALPPPAPSPPPGMAEPAPAPMPLFEIADDGPKPLRGKKVLVTAGPTVEPIDPVRVLTNRSSGKQGYAIAAALQRLGAEVTLVSGPVALEAPPGVKRVLVETAVQMLAACQEALPAQAAVLAAAVADWRPAIGTEGQEGRDRRHPGPGRKPRHPGRHRQALAQAPAPGDRLRCRDPRPGGPGPGQAPAQGLRLDRGQRRQPARRDGGRQQHRHADHRR